MLTRNRLSVLLLITLTGSLISSLFLKDQHLWMDEVLSYLLLSDPSLAHANRAVVSGMDANPPLFLNLYWLLGRGISLNPLFLKSVSVLLFAGTVVWFFRYITAPAPRRLVGTPAVNFVAILVIVSLTYLNFTLSTQLRTYSLYLLSSWAYVVVMHQLIHQPRHGGLLLAHLLVGTAFIYTHNMALFYVAGTGVFFALLWLRTRSSSYVLVLGMHLLLVTVWLVSWLPSFLIQSQSGKPHSWIPVPTFWSFFRTVGELLPVLSASVETTYPVLNLLRVAGVAGLFLWIAVPRLRRGEQPGQKVAFADPAFSLYVLSGFLVGFTLLLGLAVSLAHTSVFLHRYFWPSTLLLTYQLLYGGWLLYAKFRQRAPIQLPTLRPSPALQTGALLFFAVGVGRFIAFQNKKVPLFSGEIRHDLVALKPGQPVLLESAYYFLPLRFYQSRQPICFLLDWPTALDKRNVLESTTDYKILEGVAQFYPLSGLIRPAQFNGANFGRFYVVDEVSRYQIEAFVASGQVKIHRVISSAVAGHRILDCSFTPAGLPAPALSHQPTR